MNRKKYHPFNLPMPGWGERRMTTEDFMLACEREGITVRYQVIYKSVRGLFFRVKGFPFITIHPRLKGSEKLYTEFHELGHYFLHDTDDASLLSVPGSDEPLSLAQQWAETEATAAGLIATAPGFSLLTFVQICERNIRRRRAWQTVDGYKKKEAA